MQQSTLTDPHLFVEGVKLKPTALRILRVLDEFGAWQTSTFGCTTADLATVTRQKRQVVRARLVELRRLGLIDSGQYRDCVRRGPQRLYAHALTAEGIRRVRND